MKAKYKIDNLVEHKDGGHSEIDVIDSITTTRTGFEYRMKNSGLTIEESKIVAAYRPIKAKAPRKVTAKPRAAKPKKEAQTEATVQ